MAFFILTDFKLALLAWETFQFMFDYHGQNAHGTERWAIESCHTGQIKWVDSNDKKPVIRFFLQI